MAPPIFLPESVLAASWLHSMLFVVEIILAIRYFARFNGHRRFDVVVGLIVANAIVTLFFTCANAWKLLIIHRVTQPTQHSWPLPMLVLCKNVSATIGQSFLVYRYYGLSKSIFWTAFVLLMISVHITAGSIVGVDLFVHPEFGRPLAKLANTIAYSIRAATDVVIPILLIWELRKIKTTYSSTQSFIRRIIVNAASSGCIVALAEVFALVLFLDQYNVVLLGCAIVGPFYGITVLVNLFVCQRSVAYPPTTPTKTGNLTTLDSDQLSSSLNPPHLLDHSGQSKELNEKHSKPLS